MKPQARKAATRYSQTQYPISERRACRLFRLSRTVAKYKTKRSDHPKLVERLKELAAQRRRFGAKRLHILLRREGFNVNLKKSNAFTASKIYFLKCARESKSNPMFEFRSRFHQNPINAGAWILFLISWAQQAEDFEC